MSYSFERLVYLGFNANPVQSRVGATTNYSFKHLKPSWYLWPCHSGQGRPVLHPGNLLPTSYHPRHRTGGPQNIREVERNKNVITLNLDNKICPFFYMEMILIFVDTLSQISAR